MRGLAWASWRLLSVDSFDQTSKNEMNVESNTPSTCGVGHKSNSDWVAHVRGAECVAHAWNVAMKPCVGFGVYHAV